MRSLTRSGSDPAGTSRIVTLNRHFPEEVALADFFISLLESLVGGYLSGTAVYLLALLIITRLGRKLLMRGDRVSVLYTALLALTWLLASLAGAYVCCSKSPLAPYGTIGLPIILAMFFGGVVLRNTRQMRGQQSAVATLSILAMILLGTAWALKLNHAFVSAS